MAKKTPEDEFEASIRLEQQQLRARRLNERRLERLDGMALTGVRLADKTNPEVGMVVTFTEDEAKPVIDAIRGVLETRLKQE